MKRLTRLFGHLGLRGPRLAAAMRETVRGGYRWADFQADAVAGVVTGIVALPLSMALAIATGVPPQYGLYTTIVAGGLIALLGGSRVSVSGPTAAFVVVLAPITARHGLAGLLLATFMAGFILILLGMARLGRYIQFVPHPVTTGFTSGIAVVIAMLQVRDFLGLTVEHMPEHFLERVAALWHALPTWRWPDLAAGLLALGLLIFWRRVSARIPASLVALLVVTLLAAGLAAWRPSEAAVTINSRFTHEAGGAVLHGIPRQPPLPGLPWDFPGPRGEPLVVNLALFRELLPAALAIAVLGAIESLLCAVVADSMTNRKHDPDSELVAQGIGNVAAPFLGGFAATAAIARTATSIRAGARSPLASLVHALFVLVTVLLLAPLLGYLPMAALAALLLVVAWTMSDARHFVHVLRVAPRADVAVLLICFLLTVVFDMVVSIGVGVVLSSLLFMKRMSDLSSVHLNSGRHPHALGPMPEGVLLYEIGGPLFFGAAEKAAVALTEELGRAKVVILFLGQVPTIDVTGLVALESTIRKWQESGALVILAGVQPEPARILARAGIHREPGKLSICRSLAEAETLARLVHPGGAGSSA